MISLYILGTVLPSLITGQCQVDLDALTGEFPPLLIQRGDFVFPSSRTEEDKRILTFEDGSPLDLYCHGSEKGQPSSRSLLPSGLPRSLILSRRTMRRRSKCATRFSTLSLGMGQHSSARSWP